MGHDRDTALSVPVERSGLGPIEAALSQLPRTLLTALFSNALGVMVVSALEKVPGALNLIICGRCVLCAGHGSTQPTPCHGARRAGQARRLSCQSRRRWWPRQHKLKAAD